MQPITNINHYHSYIHVSALSQWGLSVFFNWAGINDTEIGSDIGTTSILIYFPYNL